MDKIIIKSKKMTKNPKNSLDIKYIFKKKKKDLKKNSVLCLKP